MIKYKLLCNDCQLNFDSWFSSSLEYEKLKKKKLLICHNCNSEKVEKTLMAPQLISRKAKNEEKFDTQKYKKIKKTIKKSLSFMIYFRWPSRSDFNNFRCQKGLQIRDKRSQKRYKAKSLETRC